MRIHKRYEEDKDPTTRREFRATLGTRTSRRQGTKIKRAGSGKNTEPMSLSVARRVKIWAAKQKGPV